mgnify:CR=1 FL=1
MNPEQLLYAETHEWVHLEDKGGQKIATVGITAHAVEQLTDLVYMELPQPGSSVSSGTSFGEVESVKAVSDVYAPVTGEVIEVNTALPDSLEILSTDPYIKGWIAKIRITDESNLGNLMDFAAYQKQCAEEGH